MKDWPELIARIDAFLARVERLLPPAAEPVDWKSATAFRWRKHVRGGYLQAVKHPHAIRFADLRDIDEQKKRLRENTLQFVEGRPANNVLLTRAAATCRQ